MLAMISHILSTLKITGMNSNLVSVLCNCVATVLAVNSESLIDLNCMECKPHVISYKSHIISYCNVMQKTRYRSSGKIHR